MDTPPRETNRLRTLLAACVLVLSILAVGLAPPVMAQSAGGNDTLIIGTNDGSPSYHELNDSGSVLSSASPLDGGMRSVALPSHDADHTFVGNNFFDDQSIARWNRTTQTNDWETNFGDLGQNIHFVAVDGDGNVWGGLDNGSAVKLDPDDGSVLSTNDFRDGGSSADPVEAELLEDGSLLIVYTNDDIVKIDPSTATVEKRFTPQEDISTVAVDEDGFYYVGGGGNITKFDDNGFVLDTLNLPNGPSRNGIVATEGNVFVSMGSDGVARYDFESGNEVWNDSANAVSVALTKDSDVIVMESNAAITSFNSTDGSQNWRFDISGDPNGAMVITNATEFSNVPLASDPGTELVLNADEYMQHGSDQDYSVTFTTDADGSSDVSDEASVSSDNTSIVTVDETAHTLSSTSDTSVNDQATVTATFTDPGTGIEYTDEVNVTVAQPTMKNFKILPSSWRINALFSFDMGSGDSEQDTLPLIILISIFAGGITARVVSSFAGIGAMLLIIIVGWFGGWVGTGVVLSALFVGLFIGFNLAANIDYAVRR